jgi:hypothetical protein
MGRRALARRQIAVPASPAAEPAGRVITAALVVVPGPGDTVTFVWQERGRIAMTNLRTGETFGRQANVCGR